MRRRLVALFVVLAVLALAVLPGSSGAIVCPVAARAANPCCGPITAAHDPRAACCLPSCCGPGALCCAAEPACTSALTIASSPNPAADGRRVTISGRLVGGSSRETVALWQRLPGQSSFGRVAQTTTNASGDYSIVRRVQTNSTWYTAAGAQKSVVLVEHVSAQVKLASWTVAGRLLKLNGQVSPSHRGEGIALQQRTGKGWRTIARTVLGRHSRFTVRHRFAHKGNVVLRALFGGDARNVGSASSALRLFVH